MAARLAWTSAEFGRPRSTTATLDGRTVTVDGSHRVDLSEVTDGELRVLVAEPVQPHDRDRTNLLFPYSKRGVSGDEGIVEGAAAPSNERLLGPVASGIELAR